MKNLKTKTKYSYLNDEEKQTIDSLHKGLKDGTIKIKKPSKRLIERYQKIAKNTLKKDKRITFRISSKDYLQAKAKAAELGVPYQTWIASVIHQNVKQD